MLEIALVAALGVALVLGILLYVALRRGDATAALSAVQRRQDELSERLERELRDAVAASARDVRTETGARLAEVQAALVAQTGNLSTLQTTQLATFGQQVSRIAEVTEANSRANREEAAVQLQNFGAGMQQQLTDLTSAVQRNLAEVRDTLQSQLLTLQQGNETKLDQMRATVEEKLQTTLEARLGESFRQVSDRLEQVHKGLGEMQTLAAGVGDLKRVLTNVKTRGGFGEVQLGALLEQMLTADQYAANVAPKPGSNDRVEYAIRLPGRDTPCWLPIDAKFPVEDYERLHAAQERADLVGAEEAARALENRIKGEAKRIREKYIESPHTTDFALLFLPTEGLYAEVLRRPGLVDGLQREQRVIITGPTTLAAILNSLQMGFRSLALEKRSAEVWQVLGAVKTEFGKFGEVLAKLKDQLQTASNTIEKAETRTRQMDRALKSVEAMPQEQSARLLPSEPTAEPTSASTSD
jgi:DNA recombination protein RmuC